MGNAKTTIQNLKVVKVYPNENLIVVKGSVPGAKGSVILISN